MTGLIARYYEQWGTLAGQWGALAAGGILIVSTVNAATGSVFSFLGPIPLIIFLLAMVLAVACKFAIDDEDRKRVTKLIGVSFFLKCVFIVLVLNSAFLSAYVGDIVIGTAWGDDSLRYDQVSWSMAMDWQAGEFTGVAHTHFAYYYVLAIFYFLFGHSMLGALLVNAFFSSALIIVMFKIGELLFDRQVAWRAACFMVIFTGYTVTSSRLLRDTIIYFLMAFFLYHAIKFVQTLRPGHFFLAISTVAILYPFRLYIAMLMLVIAALLWFMARKVHYVKKAVFFLSVLMGVGLVQSWIVPQLGFLGYRFFLGGDYQGGLNLLLARQSDQGGRGWDYRVNISEDRNLLNAAAAKLLFSRKRDVAINLVVGSFRVMFSPFAWVIPGLHPDAPPFLKNFLNYSMYIGQWLWYFLIPATVVGMYHIVREKRREATCLIVMCLITISIFALAYTSPSPRFFYQVLGYLLIFASYGLTKLSHPVWIHSGWGVCLFLMAYIHLNFG